MPTNVGDRLRIKSDGRRGVAEKIERGRLVIRLAEESGKLTVSADGVTYYSLAARKAWAKMPDRKVGRPRGSRVCDRLSVTIRVDRPLWEEFRRYEELGRIEDRTD